MVTLVHFTMEMYGGVDNTTMQISTPGRCAALVAVDVRRKKKLNLNLSSQILFQPLMKMILPQEHAKTLTMAP